MANKKTIAVVGATGAQGGGLARAILNDPEGGFAVRALTRKTDSEKARELARRGAEVVAADLDDLESLKRAFRGAYGAYCVTNYWEHFSPDKELAQAANMAEAARQEGLEHVIWSTLDDTRQWIPIDNERMPTIQGRFNVPHYDIKGEADEEFRKRGVPTTFLQTSYYWENLIYFGMQPKRGPDGVLALTLPMADKKLPGIASEDIGKAAYGIFKRGKEAIGETIAIAGGHPTVGEMAAVLGDVLGEEVRYDAVSHDAYRAFGFPGADDLGNMFQFKCDFEAEYCGARSIEETRKLNPELQSFAEWARRNKDRIPIEPKSGG